ncbi:MAG: ABC transporter ATP-binding protein [bacterium]|nr:ABC transporter ATP-binding protein [bacterium]
MKSKKQTVIELDHVYKIYTLHHEKPTFVENVVKLGRKEQFTALEDINLRIYKGEKVGIIGSNGSGKTTLLKIIVGITRQNSGTVKIKGRIVSLIDVEAGFHPDLTGEENIFLNGLIIGMNKQEIRNKFEQIVKFADIGKFIDASLYSYSEGMKLRLGFAVAVHAEPDILILDEGISAGDKDFQKKSSKKIEEFFKKGKTILIVSHWLEYLEKNCDRIIWIGNGKIISEGNKEVLESYIKGK